MVALHTQWRGGEPARRIEECKNRIPLGKDVLRLRRYWSWPDFLSLRNFNTITGDLANWDELQAYEDLKKALIELPCPVRLLVGNHDNRTNFLRVFIEQLSDPNGYVNYIDDFRGTCLISLDTTEAQTHVGHFGPEWPS